MTMTMPPTSFGNKYPFSAYNYQSPKCYSGGTNAITDKPHETDLQKLDNTIITRKSKSDLYEILMHLIKFHLRLDDMLSHIKTDNIPKESSSMVVTIELEVTVIPSSNLNEPSSNLNEPSFTLGDALVKLNSIERYINVLLSNVISLLKRKEEDTMLKHEKQKVISDNVEKLGDMKKKLLELSKFIERVLSHYKHETLAGTVPKIIEIIKVTADIIGLLNINNDQTLLQIENKGASYHQFLASVIGLTCEVGEQVERAQKKFPDHQTDLYYLKYIISANIDDVLCTSVPPSSVSESINYTEILEKSGFTCSKASTLAILICEKDPDHHQSLAYWIDVYLEWVFKYDIFLNDKCPRFPHNKELDKWFILITNRDGDDDFEVVPIKVECINKSIDGAKTIQNNSIRFPFSDERKNYWYHGTDHKSAELIRINGVKLNRGNLQQDFSDGGGFYLTPRYECANEWANKRCSSIIKGAVLVFECSIQEFSGIDLYNDESKWKETITYYRSGMVDGPKQRTIKHELDKTDYLEGQMSGDGTRYFPGWKPTKKLGDLPQLCIKSVKMAEKFTNNLKGIIFFA